MDYQLPPQTLQLASNSVVGNLMSTTSNSNNALTQQQLQQQQNAQLQLLQLNHQHQQQQQQQQLVSNQQQQQQLLSHMTTQQQTLPSLSSLPLQMVNQLPQLLANNNNNNNNNNTPNLNNLNILSNNLNTNNNNNSSSSLSNNNNNQNNTNSNITINNNNSNLTCNSPTNVVNNNANNLLLRNTMQHVANANQQLQQTINSLSNNLVSSLPPSTQLLQHHLQHLANVNNAVVQLNSSSNNNNNNNSNSNNTSNSSSPSNNSLSNNNNNNNLLLNSNNNNNPTTPNNNLANHLTDNVVAHNIVNGLVGVLNNVNNNNNNNNGNNNNNTTNLNNNNNNNSINNQNSLTNNLEDNNRWTQFQVQQLWKQHASYLNGKSTSNSKEVICPDDKYKEEGDLWNVEAQTAFLGPNLWEKTLPYDADLKVTQYADLDEFLSENNIPDGLPGTHLGHSSSLGHRSDSLSHAAGLSLGLGHITTKRERSPSPSDCISPDTLNPPSPAESIFDIPAFSFASSGRDFDPRTRAFSDEELKPQPMIKKSRKQFVPDELKDDKYWARRRKNNIAAKRSRDARRQKENQIAMRARYLEKENATLHQEVEQLKQENMDLRARLSKFQDV